MGAFQTERELLFDALLGLYTVIQDSSVQLSVHNLFRPEDRLSAIPPDPGRKSEKLHFNRHRFPIGIASLKTSSPNFSDFPGGKSQLESHPVTGTISTFCGTRQKYKNILLRIPCFFDNQRECKFSYVNEQDNYSFLMTYLKSCPWKRRYNINYLPFTDFCCQASCMGVKKNAHSS
jgi:hypothetical protein